VRFGEKRGRNLLDDGTGCPADDGVDKWVARLEQKLRTHCKKH
jgi:hypothetical protein